MPVLAQALAILPPLLLVWFIVVQDANRKPLLVLGVTFLLGMLIAILICVIEWPFLRSLRSSSPANVLWMTSVVACAVAVTEEVFKFLVLISYSARRRPFKDPMDGIMYGATASMGFALAENVLYVLQGGFWEAIMRALTALPLHAGLGTIMGCYVGRARSAVAPFSEAYRLQFQGLGVAIVLHALYDFPGIVFMFAAHLFPGISSGAADEDIPGSEQILIGGLAVVMLVAWLVTIVWASVLLRRYRAKQRRASLAPAG
jgi:RsiW-degrading membrane proteinase PrsW (M82 family)